VKTSSERSWKALLGKLWRLHRTKVFDNPGAPPIDFSELLVPGRTTIVDLSDTESSVINNLVISSILRGLQLQQEIAYERAAEQNVSPSPSMIIIEEAHEFLSRKRIAKMPNLFEQVARISRRGRKRWLGLIFVTQLPQHLPDEVLGLINNYILHKIADTNVVSRLKRSVGGIDEGLWNRLPNLAPGQAIVSMASMARPLLVAINPTPCKLRMIE
jgi:DNA helicase HerA-like ATPase